LPTFTHRDLDSPADTVLSKDKERNKARDRRLKTITGSSSGQQYLDYEEGLYFADSKYAKLISRYQNLERILTLEWFMAKITFKHDSVCFLDQAIESGLPFWHDFGD
jgi:hypothetical protein